VAERIAQTFDTFGGVVKRETTFNLRRDQLLVGRNCRPLSDGASVGRGGQSEYNATAIDASPIHSLRRWYKQDGTGILLAASGGSLYEGDDGDGTFASIGSMASARITFTAWASKDKVYLANGSDPLKSYDGTTLADVAGAPVARFVEQHENRLWAFDGNIVRFTDLNVDTPWPGSNGLNLADAKGGTGAFLKSLNNVLIAGKTTGLWRFQGSPVLGASLDQYSEIGCVAPHTAVTTPFGVVFLGLHGVYVTDGFSVQKISDDIDQVLNDRFSEAVAGYCAQYEQYWLALAPSNVLWVATRVQRPGGTAIEWHEYTGFKVNSLTTFDGGTDHGEVFFGLTDNGKVHRAEAGQLDVGVKYNVDVQIRHDDFGQPRRNKKIKGIEALFESPTPVNISIDYDIGKRTASLSSPKIRGVGDELVWDVGNWDQKVWASGISSGRWFSLKQFKGDGRTASLLFRNTGDGPEFKLSRFTLEGRLKSRRIRRDRVSFGSY